MAEEDPDFGELDEERDSYREPDSYAEEAKDELRGIFANTKQVQYVRQLAVKLEKKFYHWVTARAVNSLIEEGTLRYSQEPLIEATRVKFIYHRRNRYPRRRIAEALSVIREYSTPGVTRACGRQAEILFLNALALRGFVAHGRDTNEYGGKRWTKSDHNLDFIIERDGIIYGCEVKNTWGYIDPFEMRIKMDICDHLGIVPFFILRNAPKVYLEEIRLRAGVFSIFVAQIYPFGMEDLVDRIKETLELPVDSPLAIPDGIIDRFIKVHDKRLSRIA